MFNRKKKYKYSDVFGQSRKIPLNYIERDAVDKLFRESLASDQHMVIHGSSKQGKTSLRKFNLNDDQFILIHCSNKWDIGKLNEQILKQAGYEIRVSKESTVEGNAKVTAKINIPSVFEVGGEAGSKTEQKTSFKTLELDVYDVNDIVDSLQEIKFSKYIILEDFHYLNEETQRDFTFQLKAFNEMSSFTFIIIGVWLEDNKLTLLNGDLAGRIFSINADVWERDELKDIIIKGEKLLNIHFTHQLKEKIIDHSLGSVFLLQEICKSACKQISETKGISSNLKIELEELSLFEITKDIIQKQKGRYESFLRIVAAGRKGKNQIIYKLILHAILEANTEQLLNGLPLKDISKNINEVSKNEADEFQLIEALNQFSTLQMLENVKPRILDFDRTNSVLNVVDRGFISWLVFQNNNEIKSKILLC